MQTTSQKKHEKQYFSLNIANNYFAKTGIKLICAIERKPCHSWSALYCRRKNTGDSRHRSSSVARCYIQQRWIKSDKAPDATASSVSRPAVIDPGQVSPLPTLSFEAASGRTRAKTPPLSAPTPLISRRFLLRSPTLSLSLSPFFSVALLFAISSPTSGSFLERFHLRCLLFFLPILSHSPLSFRAFSTGAVSFAFWLLSIFTLCSRAAFISALIHCYFSSSGL